MPRSKKPLDSFIVDLMEAGVPTKEGRIYPTVVVENILGQLQHSPVTIEEVSPLERKAKGIPVCYSWPEHAMAKSSDAEIVDNHLKIKFDVINNKYGKLLKKTYDEHKLKYIPVGIGDVNEKNEVTEYKIQYVTFKVEDGTN